MAILRCITSLCLLWSIVLQSLIFLLQRIQGKVIWMLYVHSRGIPLMIHRHILNGGSKITFTWEFYQVFYVTGSPMLLVGGYDHTFCFTSHILMLWEFYRTHLPTFCYPDRQIAYMMMVFSISQRLVDMSYSRALVFLMYMHKYDPQVTLLII